MTEGEKVKGEKKPENIVERFKALCDKVPKSLEEAERIC